MLLTLLIVFGIGYLLIAFEHLIGINKTATALLTGVLCWTIYLTSTASPEPALEALAHHLAEIAEILFFLLGAMAIVELIDAHDGFTIITDRIASRNSRVLLWIISLFAFFLSALLDNLTASIVMVSVTRKLVRDAEQRRLVVGMIVVAANAGGVWSPIGDVTTTMLWIGGQITAISLMKTLFIPSLLCLLVPLLITSFSIAPGQQTELMTATEGISRPYVTPRHRRDRQIMFAVGLGGLLFVPIFKTVTHLPPYMGMMLVLGIIWALSEIIHADKDEEDREPLSAAYALSKVDVPSILFFLGILLAVGTLESTGLLRTLAQALNRSIGDLDVIVLLIGVASAIVDNVPIVAAAMGMYDLATYPPDANLWNFLAYCAGTGGSLLIIGSAAGIAVMGMERLSFGWYLRKISWLALIGYLVGAGAYLALTRIF